MAELSLLRLRGGSSGWGNCSKPAGALQRKPQVLLSPRAAGVEDEEKWQQKVCAGVVAAALMLGYPQTSPTSNSLLQRLGEASASGLLQMPPRELNNRYYLVRAGLSQFESQGVIHTNPVSKTSVDSGLSDEGLRQTRKAAFQLRTMGACEDSCWIWPSITQRSYQAAELIAYINSINYSRIVPEYSFLDARGLGAYEGQALTAMSEIYAKDLESPTIKPPPYTDGTPNESVVDVLVRVTQLMSILETQYFGDTVVIVSPDSDNLSVLQSALTGQDLRRHSELAFVPGEVRRIDSSDIPAPRPLVSGKLKCANDGCR